jgi:hypothetical protein
LVVSFYLNFESSEVSEKRQLLNLVFQNLQLKDVNLSVQVTEPFKTMVDYKEHIEERGRLDGFRTFDWAKLKENLLNMSINRVKCSHLTDVLLDKQLLCKNF